MVQSLLQDFAKASAVVEQFCHGLMMLADPKPYHVEFLLRLLACFGVNYNSLKYFLFKNVLK